MSIAAKCISTNCYVYNTIAKPQWHLNPYFSVTVVMVSFGFFHNAVTAVVFFTIILCDNLNLTQYKIILLQRGKYCGLNK